MNVFGKVRGQGRKQRYAGGEQLERLVIHVERAEAKDTPGKNSVRVPVTVRIGRKRYRGGLLLRHKPKPFVSLSPNLIEAESGSETTLATVLNEARIGKRDPIRLTLADIEIVIGKAD